MVGFSTSIMTSSPLRFLDGGGEMAEVIRRHDWSRSRLGSPAAWPDALKMAVGTCLSSRFPMVVWWGPDLIMLYNDAWAPILGERKHPAGLGRPGAESWPETWSIVGPQFEAAPRGTASWSEDLLLASDRRGFLEECYFTYSHSPLRDGSGDIVGVFSAVAETTMRVLGDRRRAKLHALSETAETAIRAEATVRQTCEKLIEVLCSDNPDAPFAILYLREAAGGAFRLRASAGLDSSAAIVPDRLSPAADLDPWGVLPAIASGQPTEVAIGDRLGPLPGGPWPEPCRQIAAYPLFDTDSEANISGLLVCGVNARLQLDGAYRAFLGSAANRIAASISNVGARRTARRRSDAEAQIWALQRRLFRTPDLPSMLNALLDAVIEAHGADRGNIQLYDGESRALFIAAHRGFDGAFLSYFRSVSAEDGSACAQALREGSTVTIEDVERDLEFAPHRPIAASAAFRAVVSTPMVNSETADPVGMISVHFAAPHRPHPQTVVLAELYARVGAELIVRRLAEQRIRDSEARLHQANESLERRVEARTGELAAANRELLKEIERRTEAEDTLRQMQRLEAVGQVAAGVAHDFNNLLAVVLGNAEFLRREIAEQKPLRRIEMIAAAAERGAKLIGQLLAFSRQQRLEPKTLDLNAVITAMRDLLATTVGPAIRLQTALAPQAMLALADQTQLELVILNLAVNARDAMPDGGRLVIRTRNVAIRHRSERLGAPHPGPYVVLSVRDTGSGMSPDVLAKAFEPFFTTKAVGAGSGLGLAQVYGFATQSDGGVTIRSHAGRGASISLYLPQAIERAQAVAPAPDENAPGSGDKVILIVDDDDDVRVTQAEALQHLGYRVVEAGSGAAALDILGQREDIDALVLDYGMPGMTGADLARQVSSQWPRLPIVFLTGYADHPGLRRIQDVIVQKPVRPAELASHIELAIAART